MSHELRTPLNAILGFSALLREGHGGPLTEEQARQIGFVHEAGEHLLALINDLLDVTRIEAGRAELSVDDFDLAVVIGQVAASLGPMVRAKGLSFSCETGGSPLPMRGDRRRCFQVLLNLAGNAVKFTDAGEVRIAAAAAGERVEIVVSDTGTGIAPEHMPMLFEAFRQLGTGRRREQEGTGLGLHLSRRLVEAMGGSIRARSAPGEGSVFTVLMPRTAAAAAQACASTA
jgi:protein-histidine pros-kinase